MNVECIDDVIFNKFVIVLDICVLYVLYCYGFFILIFKRNEVIL